MNRNHRLFVIWGKFPPFIGGGAARGYRVYKALSERGHTVTVFTAKHHDTKISKKVSPNFQIVRVPPLLIYPPKKGRLAWLSSIVTSTIRYFNLYLFLLYFYLKHKPDIIIKEATTWAFDSPRILRYFRLDVFRIASHIAPWILLKKLARAPLLIYFTRLWHESERYVSGYSYSADKIIVVDKWMEKALIDTKIGDAFFYLPVCIDTNTFQPDEKRPVNKVLFISRLERERACDVLLEATPHIISSVPDCRILIVGEGSEEPALRKMADELNITSHVTFVGPMDPQHIEKVYREVKVFVNPLRLPGISNVTIESMACGIPVVKSTIDGYDGYPIKDGENGYLFKIDDYLDLADKVVKILQNPHWADLSKAARETAMQFDIQVSINELERIIRETTQISKNCHTDTPDSSETLLPRTSLKS